jgi:hypothetical protein
MSYSTYEIAKIYEEASIDVAKFIGVLRSYKERFDYISSQTMDNADPACDAGECLEKLAELISSIIIYKTEYLEDAEKEKNKKIEGEN